MPEEVMGMHWVAHERLLWGKVCDGQFGKYGLVASRWKSYLGLLKCLNLLPPTKCVLQREILLAN